MGFTYSFEMTWPAIANKTAFWKPFEKLVSILAKPRLIGRLQNHLKTRSFLKTEDIDAYANKQ